MKIKSIEIIASTEPLLRWVTNIDEPSLDIEVIALTSSSRSKQSFFADKRDRSDELKPLEAELLR